MSSNVKKKYVTVRAVQISVPFKESPGVGASEQSEVFPPQESLHFSFTLVTRRQNDVNNNSTATNLFRGRSTGLTING